MRVLDYPIPQKDWADAAGQRNGFSVARLKHHAEKPLADAGPWEPAVQKIVEFQDLGDDWDG
jgi:hypothetical protein